jgi:transposase
VAIADVVVEVTGGKRTRGAKNDRIDAAAAARTALARDHRAEPRSPGIREALRQVLSTRQAVRVSRTKAHGLSNGKRGNERGPQDR